MILDVIRLERSEFIKFQLPLWFFLLMVIPVALFAMAIADDKAQDPIQWEPFTYAAMEGHIAEQRSVVMLGIPGYHVGGEFALRTFDDVEIRRSFHDGDFVPMVLEYDDWDGHEIRNLFRRFGHTKHPIAMIFVPNAEPTKLDPYSPTDILKHLPKRLHKRKWLMGLGIGSLVLIVSAGWIFRPNRENVS